MKWGFLKNNLEDFNKWKHNYSSVVLIILIWHYQIHTLNRRRPTWNSSVFFFLYCEEGTSSLTCSPYLNLDITSFPLKLRQAQKWYQRTFGGLRNHSAKETGAELQSWLFTIRLPKSRHLLQILPPRWKRISETASYL